MLAYLYCDSILFKKLLEKIVADISLNDYKDNINIF